MASNDYERYGLPVPPEDPDQEFMTVQETAHVLRCSVSWLRRFLAKNRNLHSYHGRRIVTDRGDRAAIKEATRAGVSTPSRRRSSRPRRTAAA